MFTLVLVAGGFLLIYKGMKFEKLIEKFIKAITSKIFQNSVPFVTGQ